MATIYSGFRLTSFGNQGRIFAFERIGLLPFDVLPPHLLLSHLVAAALRLLAWRVAVQVPRHVLVLFRYLAHNGRFATPVVDHSFGDERIDLLDFDISFSVNSCILS